MDSTISVSKGCFVFKNGATRAKNKRKNKTTCSSLLDKSTIDELWYGTYKRVSTKIKEEIDLLQSTGYGKVLGDLLKFIETCHTSSSSQNVLPTAALLTGINQPDHLSQFETLSDNIKNNTFSIVVVIQSRDCPTMKAAIETIVSSIVQEQSEDAEQKHLRRNQLNLLVLKSWYHEKYDTDKPNLTIIIPDFEVFNSEVLQDLIIVLNSYSASLPFVLILGVATSVAAIHNVLPYHVTSKIKLHVFQSEPSIENLNKILDKVLLSPYCPFHLSGKAFKLLVDIFLFYDFSVNGFIEGFKYCLMEHYYQGNAYALCDDFCDDERVMTNINFLNHGDLEMIRQLPSFRPYIESQDNPQNVIDLLTNDSFLKEQLSDLLANLHDFWFNFHCSLELLQIFVQDLPKTLLGKQLRELYATCISSDVTQLPEFAECIQYLGFLSKEEIVGKLSKMVAVIKEKIDANDTNAIQHSDSITVFNVESIEATMWKLLEFCEKISEADMSQIQEDSSDTGMLASPKMGRQELKEKLLNAAKQPRVESSFQKYVNQCLTFVTEDIIRKYLKPFSKGPTLIELFVFSDSQSVRRHIVGVPRASVHTALNNPHYYLQCECCTLDNSASLVKTLPDISVAYKLHLECGRMINLFDWLQAFRTVVDDFDTDQDQQIDPKIQARFTRAVAELQFLGFVKASKKKTDHVTRLTW